MSPQQSSLAVTLGYAIFKSSLGTIWNHPQSFGEFLVGLGI